MKRLLWRLGVAAAFVGFLALPASAGTLTFQLDYVFSGTTTPAGPAPWVQAAFEDVVGGVQLTITATNLTGSEFISDFYFNFNPILNAASYLPSPTGGTQIGWNSITAGNNCCKADGDGYFDFNIDFPPPPGNGDLFKGGETFVVRIPGALTTADFNYVSVNGPKGATGFYAAAHVQGIATEHGTTSVWIAPSPSQVPEPGTLLLLGAGLTGLASVRRRRSRR